MYSAEFQDSIRAVEEARAANIAYEPARMTAQEKEDRTNCAKCCRRIAASRRPTWI